jgi:hypothetical protein
VGTWTKQTNNQLCGWELKMDSKLNNVILHRAIIRVLYRNITVWYIFVFSQVPRT